MPLSTSFDSMVSYICIRVPLQCHPQPIISQLISRYSLRDFQVKKYSIAIVNC